LAVDEPIEVRLGELLDAEATNEAVSLVISRLGPKLRGFVHAVMLDRGAAEEVWADVTLDIYRGLGSWSRERPILPWCLGVARNACRRYWRGQRASRRSGPIDPNQGWTFSQPQPARSPTPMWKTTPARQALEILRASLTADERTLLILRVDKQLPWREVTSVMHPELESPAALSRREAALRKRFERTLARLRKLARDKGYITE